jgi:hypothetical protein
MEARRDFEAEMPFSQEEMDRIGTAGEAIYQERLKAILEPDCDGQVVAIHLESGDYEVARTSSAAWKALRRRRPDGPYFLRDIGIAPWDELSMRMAATERALNRGR